MSGCIIVAKQRTSLVRALLVELIPFGVWNALAVSAKGMSGERSSMRGCYIGYVV